MGRFSRVSTSLTPCALPFIWACSTGPAASQPPGSGGGAGQSGAGGVPGQGGTAGSHGGAAANAGTAQGGTAGTAPVGGTGGGTGGTGTGGTTVSDASLPDVVFNYDGGGGAAGLTQDGACANTSVEGSLDFAPADIIFAVDTSGSMSAEQGWTQNNMPAFANTIAGSGIDAHVVLIANTEMCVPPPLGSGACGGADTNLPGFLHVNQGVGSHDALNKIINTFPQWKPMLRPSSVKSFVVVSDDNATSGPNNSAAAFTTSVNALDPSLIAPNSWTFHGIVSSQPPFLAPCLFLSAARGDVYIDLISQTGGVFGDLCLQDFAPVFNQLATAVVNSAPLACDIPMPKTDAGIINPADVKIELVLPPNPGQVLTNVGSAGGCGTGGWYYDDPAAPTQITLCPETCNAANSVTNPKVNVLLGCLGS